MITLAYPKHSVRLARTALAVLVAAVVAPSLRADSPTLNYYPSEIITLPAVSGTPGTPEPVAYAMNDQGYILVGDMNPYGSRVPRVYFNHTLYTLNLGTFTATSVYATFLSNTAADGSFWVAGTYLSPVDGYTRAVRWHVFADGTSSAPDVTTNRVLPPDSENPGEQSVAEPSAINSSGQMVGFGLSYLVDVPLQWLPGDDTADDVPGITYPGGVSGLDDSGNVFGVAPQSDGTTAPIYGGQILPILSADDYYQLSSITGSKLVGATMIADAGEGTSVAFVYDVNSGVTTLLPTVESRNGGTPFHNDSATRVNAAGDVVGRGSSDYTNVLWKYDATTGTYTSYREDFDLGPILYNGTQLQFNGGNSDYALTGIAADGTLAMSYAQYYDPTLGLQSVIVLLKPGPDPRPVINPTDPTVPGAVTIHTEPGQAFSYQFTATNSPTAFKLLGNNTDVSYTLPDGVTFNTTTGVFAGTGPANGLYSFAVEATNGQGYGALIAYVTFASGDAPVVLDQSVTAHLNQLFSYKVAVAPASSSLYLEGTLPAGVSFDPTTSLLSGTPTQAGTFPLTITAYNDIGQNTATLTLTVDSQPPAAFTVSLLKPAANQNVIAGNTLTVKAKVDLSAAGSETVASLAFLLDGAPVGTLTAKPYKAAIPIDGTLSGPHTLTVLATGNDGRTATSAPVTINVTGRFVDLGGTATIKPKLGTDGSVTFKGQYTLFNQGNTAMGPFPIRFYLSNDANFDASDVSLDPLVLAATGKDPTINVPGLPANTTLSSTDLGSILPKLKLSFSSNLVSLLIANQGKYILAVIDPDNTAGESASTRANNVIAFQIPSIP